MKYQTLKAGDVRQQGDEHRCNTTAPATSGGFSVINGKALRKTKAGAGLSATPTTTHGVPQPTTWSDWAPAQLIGHVILAADLCNAEFRRPVQKS